MLKKYFIPLLFILVNSLNFSQSQFNAGASFNIGFPTSSFSDIAKTGIGGSMIGEYAFNQKISTTISASYQNYPGDFAQLAIEGKVINVSLNSIPVLIGLRYYFSNGFFGMLEAGAHFFRASADISDLYSSEKLSTDYESKFGGGVGAGYRYRLADASVLEFSGTYQIVEDDFNSVALRIGILILLDNI